MNRAETASNNLLQSHMNCAQSVLAAFCEELGLSKELALKMVMGFGGGMGHTGSTCGAVVGAYLVLGLKLDLKPGDLQPYKDKAVADILEFSRRFKEIHGSTLCTELLGYDLRSDEQTKAAISSGIFVKKCPILIRDAAQIVEEMGK